MPNFLVIGAYKCGTTSLHEYLRAHPDVFVPERKEPNFWAFDHHPDPVAEAAINPAFAVSVRDESEYATLFADRGDEAAIGEVSPEYLTNPWAAERIADARPSARLVAVLRNPVDRAFSDYLMYRRDGVETEEDFEAALDHQETRRTDGRATGFYVETGFYGRQLERYYERFATEQIHVLRVDELQRERTTTMSAVFDFLGVDPGFETPDTTEHNRSGVAESAWLRSAYRVRRGLAPRLKQVVPSSVIRRADAILQSRLSRPELPPASRARLIELYRGDIERTAELTGLDLRDWLLPEVDSQPDPG